MIGLVLDCLVKKADDCNQALQSFAVWFGLRLGLRFVVILEFKKTAKISLGESQAAPGDPPES